MSLPRDVLVLVFSHDEDRRRGAGVQPSRSESAEQPAALSSKARGSHAFALALTRRPPWASEAIGPSEFEMTLPSREALASAKKMCRTLASAPVPQARAQAIFSELARAEGWTSRQQHLIVGFGQWLATRPPPSDLKGRCEQLLAGLA